MLGMVRAQTWSYLHRPRPWREFHHCFGAGGAVSSIAGRQHGSKSAGSSATWECYWCGQRGHFARNCMAPFPVASGGEQGQSSAARQQRPPHKGNNRGHRGVGRGGIFRRWRIFAVHFCSAAAPEDQSRVLQIGVGWSGSTTDCTGGREFHHCFGAGGAVSSSAGRDACRCTGGEFSK